MIATLPQLYRLATIGQIQPKQLEDRTKTINTILEQNSLDFHLNCVRLYLKKPILNKDFKNDFVECFNATDPTFVEGLDIENSVLSIAIILELLNADNDNSLIIASALLTGLLGVQLDQLVSLDPIKKSLDLLTKTSVTVRSPKPLVNNALKAPQIKDEVQTLDTLTAHVKNMNRYIREALTQLESQKKWFEDRFEIIEEESNIHWWLFRSYSKTRQVSFQELEPSVAPLVIAKELKDLMVKSPLPSNAKDFLNKALREIKQLPETYNFLSVVETILSNFKDSLNLKDIQTYNNLAPISFALSKADELGLENSWITVFEKQSGLSTNIEISPLDLAYQFLIELSLIKL